MSMTVVIMAKRAVAGRVKTRLIGDLSPLQAAGVHQAMLDCVLRRLGDHLVGAGGQGAIAIDEPVGSSSDVAGEEGEIAGDANRSMGISEVLLEQPGRWRLVSQGSGDLGARMLRVWREIGGGPAAFFGVDSPDAPVGALQELAKQAALSDVVFGPAVDGGYWTIAAMAPPSPVFQGIAWGGEEVLAQSLEAAERANLAAICTTRWYDVDEYRDLQALRQRLASADVSANDTALATLRGQLDELCPV